VAVAHEDVAHSLATRDTAAHGLEEAPPACITGEAGGDLAL
jgi:hypothetical protein